jgi:anthraniloyl-CoA monooxygenase
MKIVCIGGGPAGLYFSILMKKARPEASIEVYERNKPDDTFGWGVVFSDETLANFEAADPETMAAIRREFVYWGRIENHFRGEVVSSEGHGFCGLSRKRLLQILQERARGLGVELCFQKEVRAADFEHSHDLIVLCDGIHSPEREARAALFEPDVDLRPCRFTWLGTTLPLEAFTFIFEQDENGLFMVHAYPFERHPDGSALSTFIVETHEDTWQRAGLDRADDAATVAYMERLFAPYLKGHRLLANRSIWRRFPRVKNARWHDHKHVLLGDAAHSAHFSIGSGTKLAMEDAIALAQACNQHPANVPAALAAYQTARYVETVKLQRAAQTSCEWFEHARRFVQQEPLEFTYNLLTRSRRITHDNLAQRDPVLVEKVTRRFAERHGALPQDPKLPVPPPCFVPFRVRDLTLGNRLVVSPMCQYSAPEGVPTDWHLVHLGSRAVGGAGLVMVEATGVEAEGRITLGCTGLWNETQAQAFRRIVDFVHQHSPAKIGIQIGHAGRKASCELPWKGGKPLGDSRAWPTVGPSALAFDRGQPVPRELTPADLERLLERFRHSARLAVAAGFDLVELHMAHGYLLSSFLSAASNQRQDGYGGDLERRQRFPLEVARAVRAELPDGMPLFARLSASDWLPPGEPGTTIEESIDTARRLHQAGVDVIDVSSGGNTPRSKIDYGRMYQVGFAEAIRFGAGVPVMAVGAIQDADQANTILAAGRADLCALARAHLSDPYLTQRAAAHYGYTSLPWPDQYLAVKPRG